MIVKGGVNLMWVLVIFKPCSIYFTKEIPTRAANYSDNYTNNGTAKNRFHARF